MKEKLTFTRTEKHLLETCNEWARLSAKFYLAGDEKLGYDFKVKKNAVESIIYDLISINKLEWHYEYMDDGETVVKYPKFKIE